MRPDFAKVLVEHERRGSSKSYRRIRKAENHLRLVEDAEGVESDAPSKRSMLKANVSHWHGKEFSENLNPLRKWLEKNVGRPWNKVYSELRQQFKPTNTINAHIYQHLFQYVELNVIVDDDGEVSPTHQPGYSRRLSGGDLYVDLHGFLRKVKAKRRRQVAQLVPEFIRIDATIALAKVDGLWFRVEMRHISESPQDAGILVDLPAIGLSEKALQKATAIIATRSGKGVCDSFNEWCVRPQDAASHGVRILREVHCLPDDAALHITHGTTDP